MKPRLSVVQEGSLRGVWICRGGPHRFGLGTTPRSAYDSWVAGMTPLERTGEILRAFGLGLARLGYPRVKAPVQPAGGA